MLRALFGCVVTLALTTQAVAQEPQAIDDAWAHMEGVIGKDAMKAATLVHHIWNFKLIESADAKAVVTVGTIVGGIVLLGLGYVAAGFVSRWVARKLLSR